MKRIILLFCLCFGTATFAQVSIKDTVQRYTNMYENGSISLFTLDTIMSNFFSTLPSDDVTSHYEKVFKRSMYFWKDRTYVNSSGVEQPDLYTSSMIEYLETPNCPNGDEAAWEFDFDPSPGTESEHQAGIITAVYMNPSQQNIILAGAGASGIWYTETGGSTWENVTDHLGVPALGIQKILDISKPTEPVGKFLIAATGKDKFGDAYGVGVLKSSDYGKTWTRHAIPEVGGKIQYLVGITKPAGSTDLIYAASHYNIFVSTDRGLTWSLLTGQPTLDDEEYYSIEASETDLIVTTVRNYEGLTGHIWKYDLDATWVDYTSDILELVNINDLTIDENELFVGSFGNFVPIEVNVGAFTFYPDLQLYGSDYAVKLQPVLTLADEIYEEQLSIKRNYLEGATALEISVDGSLALTLNAEIPIGASLILYFDGMPYEEEIVSSGSGLEEYYVYVNLSELGIASFTNFSLKAAYGESYDLVELSPILIADIDIDYSHTREIFGIGVANMYEDEVYIQVVAKSATVKNSRLFFKSENNCIDWSPLSVDRSDMALRSVFTAGYGDENGLYFGSVYFNRYNIFAGDFSHFTTMHEDVRSIQVVENIDGFNKIIVGDDGGVSLSEDGGFTWVSLNGDNFPITQFYGIGLNPNSNGSIIGGTQDNHTFV
ncbi:MAG: hypothetical protein IT222_07270, partial [Crocinitomix sp.]|nr:hypothetical protein [Crocinitomix sp.]